MKRTSDHSQEPRPGTGRSPVASGASAYRARRSGRRLACRGGSASRRPEPARIPSVYPAGRDARLYGRPEACRYEGRAPASYSLLATVVGALLLLLAQPGRGQNSQFLYEGPGGLLVQTAESSAPPQILSQPQPQVVAAGATAALSVLAADTRGLSYEWRFNGSTLGGATSDTLLVPHFAATNEGPYSVVLVNSSGSVTSAPAMLWYDGDGDGLPDTWERTYFGSVSQTATGDADGDGVSNLQEFLDGTNPTNRASASYRLSIIAEGAYVVATPTQLRYTNGQVVTLTAIAYPPYTFRGWAGDASGTNNPLTITISTNKTVIAYGGPFTLTWTNNVGGDWNNAANWTPNLVPGVLDSVYLTKAVTVTCTNSLECANLTLGGATLSVTGNLTVDGSLTWQAGTMSGSGTTYIPPGALLSFDNAGSISLTSRTLDNAGTAVWSNTGGLVFNSATFTNEPGALFLVQNSVLLNGTSSRLDNAGVFRKTSSTGTTTLGLTFNSFGTVDVQTGTLQFNSAANINGSLSLAAGTTNRFSNTGSLAGAITNPATSLVEWNGNPVNGIFAINSGAQLNGAGLYRINSENVSFNSAASVQNLDLVGGGTLSGSGDVSVTGTMNWGSSSTISGGGTLFIFPSAVLNATTGPFTVTLNTRTLDNAGTVIWSGAASFSVNNAVITNRPGALFEAHEGPSLGASAARFDNAGTFRRNVGTGTLTLLTVFNNYSLVDVQSGTLQFSSAANINGSLDLAAGTTSRFSNTGSLAGSITNPATSLVEWNGNPVNGTFAINSGAQLNGPGLYRINAENVAFNTATSVQNLDLIGGGTLSGSGDVSVTGTMNWGSSSVISGGGTLFIPTGAVMNATSGPFTINLTSRHLDNAGTVTWSGTAGFDMNSTVVTNRPGALFEAQGPNLGTSSGRFDNAGTFRKNVGTGTLTVLAVFNNYALVDVQTGTLQFNSAASINGSLNLAAGTTSRFSNTGSLAGSITNPATSLVEWNGNPVNGTFAINSGAQLNGAGLYRINSENVAFNTATSVQNLDLIGGGTLSGSGDVSVTGIMNWGSSSTITGGGTLFIGPGAAMTATSSPFSITLTSRHLENAGTVTWSGATLNVNSSVITNRAGALFDAQAASSLSTAGSRFDNAGTFRKSVSIGTLTVYGSFTNYGTMDIEAGVLSFASSLVFSPNGLLTSPVSGPTAGTGYGQLQGPGTLSLNGTLSVNVTNGYIPAVPVSFTLVSGSHSGAFANFLYPSNVYAMQLSNTASAVTVTITNIIGPPILAALPASQLFYAGRVMALSTYGGGSQPITYQWTKDGSALADGLRISGAHTLSLFVTNSGLADAGNYQLFATNSQGTSQSTVSAVAVQAVPKLNAAGAGWSLQGTTLPVMNSSNVTLTSGLGGTARSVFYKAPLYLPTFAAAFLYTDVGGGGADGMTFCLQNDARGATALGGGGSGLGYSGITPSVALAFNIFSPNTTGIALLQNGTVQTPYASTTPVNVASGHPIFVSLVYSNGVLKTTLVESNTANVFTTNYNINLPAVLGSQLAYVGFTGADGGVASTQVVSNFTFVPLTGIALDTTTPNQLGLWWPAVIGGYTMESRSDLKAPDTWQSLAAPINQVGSRNQVNVSPSPTNRFYRLSIQLGQ